MANVIIKSDERRAQEARILRDFGRGRGAAVNGADREAAEIINARTNEAIKELRKQEEKKR